jgi:guanidinobutyrase
MAISYPDEGSQRVFNEPLGGNVMPRFAGTATMFRLPAQSTLSEVDVGIIGVPLDIGTSNRSGSRFGPRQIRSESALIRPYGMATRAAPFESFQVADLGDVPLNTYNLAASIGIIERFYDSVVQQGVKPLSVGGDHTITLPILRALHRKHGPMALIHVDAHADINDEMFGEKIAHGTIFRRAIEEGLVDAKRMYQIGLRGTGYSAEDFDWTRKHGGIVVQAEECWYRSLDPLMSEVRARIGSQVPTYLSFDIDGLDPSVAPGTGTPEAGGLTATQGLEIIRGAFGTNLIGADLVEVSPPYDTSGNTALLAANLLFEMLCSFPGCRRKSAPA